MLLVSPVVYLKARKNPTEVKGMKRAHIKDAVALCDFLAKLETEVFSYRLCYHSGLFVILILLRILNNEDNIIGKNCLIENLTKKV